MPGMKRTALETATLRAAHQVIDRPLVFDDRLSVRILGNTAGKLIRPELVDRAQRAPARAAVAARSRFADDEIARAVDRGAQCCVLVGSGLDTFGFRNPYRYALEVVELEHPEGLQWKRDRAAETDLKVPGWVTYVPTDLAATPLDRALGHAGVDIERPMVVVALGAIIYLPSSFLTSLIALVAGRGRPSTLVLDYAAVDATLAPDLMRGRRAAMVAAAAVGEPFVTFLDPAALRDDLLAAGFTDVGDLDVDAINALYFDDRSDGLRLAPSGRHFLVATT